VCPKHVTLTSRSKGWAVYCSRPMHQKLSLLFRLFGIAMHYSSTAIKKYISIYIPLDNTQLYYLYIMSLNCLFSFLTSFIICTLTLCGDYQFLHAAWWIFIEVTFVVPNDNPSLHYSPFYGNGNIHPID
jgi:hypothetical protein